MPCDACLNRRAFLSQAALTTAAGLLVACGDGEIGGALAPVSRTTQLVVTVAAFPGLANVGELVKVGQWMAAKRTGSATFAAFDMTCTHAGCLTTITAGQRFDCPCHGSRFSNDGQVLRGPALDPLASLATSYDPVTDQLTIG
jgi:Rieske Fe-S protein